VSTGYRGVVSTTTLRSPNEHVLFLSRPVHAIYLKALEYCLVPVPETKALAVLMELKIR
jgi:hypothetical protein